jgi:hypothetical protein
LKQVAVEHYWMWNHSKKLLLSLLMHDQHDQHMMLVGSQPAGDSHRMFGAALPCPAGKSREEVKATLKSERAKMPRRRLTNRRRTSRC